MQCSQIDDASGNGSLGLRFILKFLKVHSGISSVNFVYSVRFESELNGVYCMVTLLTPLATVQVVEQSSCINVLLFPVSHKDQGERTTVVLCFQEITKTRMVRS